MPALRLDSLAFRLFATALAWTVLAMPLAGFIIYSLYRQEVETSFDDRLRTLLLVVYTDSDDHGTTEPGSPRDAGEPLFEIPHSGWYWQIKPIERAEGRRALSSKSLAGDALETPFEHNAKPDSYGIFWGTIAGPGGVPLRVAEMIKAFKDDDSGPRYSYLVSGPRAWPQARVAGFRTRLVTALSLVGFGMMALTLFQVRFGLSPLRQIERGLLAIRTGAAARLDGKLPLEIEPLQSEINALLQSNQDIIDRARTQVGNLAHALKTPLAVITNEAHEFSREAAGHDATSRESREVPFAAKVAEQAEVMRDQVSYYLGRAQMAARAGTIGRATEVEPVLASLRRALERIYRDKGVAIVVECEPGTRFQGEKQDLEEMMGNLVDNACKWASSKVLVTARVTQATSRTARNRLLIAVEDDGAGLTAEQRARIGKRGQRLDESKPGSGLGLSIVSDLAVSYSGRMALEQSDLGGLAVRVELPAV